MNDKNEKLAFEKWYESFMAIPDDETVYRTVPIEVATAEGALLAIVAAEDREMLINAGIDPDYLDSLDDRVAAFTYAAARYNALPDTVARLKEEVLKGHACRSELLRHFTFAYRNNAGVMKCVAKIKKSRGDRDMILDLLSLRILAETYPAPLEDIPAFDSSLLDEAKRLHNTLSELYAQAVLEPSETEERRTEFYKAYTFYKRQPMR